MIFIFPSIISHHSLNLRERISGTRILIMLMRYIRWLGTVLDSSSSSLQRLVADGTGPSLFSDVAFVNGNRHFGQIPAGRFNEE